MTPASSTKPTTFTFCLSNMRHSFNKLPLRFPPLCRIVVAAIAPSSLPPLFLLHSFKNKWPSEAAAVYLTRWFSVFSKAVFGQVMPSPIARSSRNPSHFGSARASDTHAFHHSMSPSVHIISRSSPPPLPPNLNHQALCPTQRRHPTTAPMLISTPPCTCRATCCSRKLLSRPALILMSILHHSPAFICCAVVPAPARA